MVKFKPDKKDCPVLKTDEGYPKWRETMSIVLHSHGLQVVLDIHYVPYPADVPSFLSIQRWVYAALYDKVQTYHGRAIVRRARERLHATQAFMDLDRHYNDSTAGRIVAARLLAFLTSANLDSSWNKPYSQFITEWVAKAEQYNEMCGPDAQLHESALMHMLQRAVHPIPFLRQLTNQEHLSLTKGDDPLTFDGYYNLLLSTAITHDSGGGRGQRGAFVTQRGDDTDDMGLEIDSHHASADHDETEAISRIVHSVETRPRLPDQVFSSFTAEDRKQWIGLSRDGKQQIVKLLKDSKDNTRRTVNNAIVADPEDTGSDEESQPEETDATADTTVVTANQAQSSTPSPSSDAHPADLRRVLAQKVQKRKKSSKRSASMAAIRHVGVSQRDDCDSDSGSDFSLGLDDAQPDHPHSFPMFDDSPAGVAAWHAEMERIDAIPTGGHGFRNDYQTLATYVDDYEHDGSDDSSDDDDAWCDTRNSYYDSLDFY